MSKAYLGSWMSPFGVRKKSSKEKLGNRRFGVKGKRWKEFRRNRFLRVWVRCVKCGVFAQVLV